MAPTPLRRALRRGQRQIRHVTPVAPRAASGLVAEVYAQVERDFGMLAPPVTLHSPVPPVMAASWLLLRETLIADGDVDRGAKEAVAAAVSEANACPYCVEVHSTTRDVLAPRHGTGDGDEHWVPGDGVPPQGPPDAIAEYLGVALTFEYLNRMANVFLPDSPLPPEVPARLRSRAQRVLGWVVAPGTSVAAGAALPLLPEADPPADADWVAGSGRIAAAVGAACAAIETAAAGAVPEPVMDLVRVLLADENASGAVLHPAAVDDLLRELRPDQRATARIAILTALASYRVDDAVIATYRSAGGTDASLIGLTAWASMTAARHHVRRYGAQPAARR